MSSKVQPLPAERAVYTVDEWIERIFPMARAIAYQDINSGRLKSFKRGSRRYIPASEREDYPRRLAAESGHDEAA